jgi:GDP-L-fucose synthase
VDKHSPIFVAGHRGMVGSAICRRLAAGGYDNIVARTRAELDLLDQRAVQAFLEEERPQYVFIAAAKVGGIHANDTFRAEFLYQNLQIEANLIHGAHVAGVERLMFLGSSCIYPRDCPQPIREEYLLTGPLEPTNEPYAIAKIAGIKLCESYNRQYGRRYVSAMPTNLYGPNDNYDLATSHVLPALIRKVHEAKLRGDAEFVVWGSGTPRRDFLYVDDLADACVHLMEMGADAPLLNIGTGSRRHDPGAGRDSHGCRRLPRPHRLRPQQAGRHAAQAARREPRRGARLAGAHVPPRRHRARLRECSVPVWRSERLPSRRATEDMSHKNKVALITV